MNEFEDFYSFEELAGLVFSKIVSWDSVTNAILKKKNGASWTSDLQKELPIQFRIFCSDSLQEFPVKFFEISNKFPKKNSKECKDSLSKKQ